jgi:hypothetical protein
LNCCSCDLLLRSSLLGAPQSQTSIAYVRKMRKHLFAKLHAGRLSHTQSVVTTLFLLRSLCNLNFWLLQLCCDRCKQTFCFRRPIIQINALRCSYCKKLLAVE